MHTQKNYHLLFLVVILAILATLACNAQGETPTPIIIVLSPTPSTSQATEDDTPTPTSETVAPVLTDTPVPDVSGPGGCTLNAAYVADVTVPDDTQFDPGESFTKVWRVSNSGTCDWEVGTKLVFVSGDPLGGPTSVDVSGKIVPDANIDLSVDFIAPNTPGTYRSTWRLQDPDNAQFGSHVYVQIVVPDPATDTPTPTEEADPPDLVITHLEVDTDDPRQGVTLSIVATFHNQGGQIAEDFYWKWRVCVTDGCEYITSSAYYTLEPDAKVVAQMEYTFEGWATYTTEAVVDGKDEVEESDETNNSRELVIPVKAGQPDLVIDEITFDPDPPVQGQNATIQVTVRNRGTKSADPFDVEWRGGVNFADPSCEWEIAGLGVDDTAEMQCTFAYTSWYGTITSRATADVGEAINELDETNNTLDKDTPVNQP